MEIRVQRAARALQRRHHAGLPTGNAALPGAARVHVAQHARVHAEDRAAQPVIPRHLIAQPIRHGQHHWRTGTHGSTASTRWAARSVMRRPPQLGHHPRPLQESGTRCSRAQPSH